MQLEISGAELAGYLAHYGEALNRARERVASPYAENTQRAYRVAWKQWETHCRYVGRDAYPLAPSELVTYLEQMRMLGASPNTVRLHLAALSSLDRALRQTENPDATSIRQHPIVWRWLRSWGRENPVAPRKRAPPLSTADLTRILNAARDPGPRAAGSQRRRRRTDDATLAQQRRGLNAHATRYCRDRALILVGIGAALRISELVALDACDVQRTDRGLSVHVRRGKADQHGKGRIVGILPQGNSLLCPVDAWRCWLAFRGEMPGPAFVEVDRGGELGERLTARGAEHAIQARARRVGLSLVSAHSLRVTLASEGGRRRKSLGAIMEQGGWKSSGVVAGYMRQGTLFDDTNPTAGLLDDD